MLQAFFQSFTPSRSPAARRLLAGALALLAVGCTQTKGFTGDTVADTGKASGKIERVLVMPADVELSLLMASGLQEVNAAWTQAGRTNIDAALKAELNEHSVAAVPYRAEASDDRDAIAPEDLQLFKLHGAIIKSVALHKYMPGFELPTMKDRFNYTLGDGASELGERYGADHALFLYARDSFSSGGRTALIVTAALFGVGVPGGQQLAFVSLIDLDSGDVIWFNALHSEVGDLRDRQEARSTVGKLLEGAPFLNKAGKG